LPTYFFSPLPMRTAAVNRRFSQRGEPTTGEKLFAKEQGFSAHVAWWMWPHLLSLDAPLVAVGWQRWWAHLTGANLHWFHDLILGLCVWMIYLADRLSDARRAEPGDLETQRHAFSRRCGVRVGILLGAVVVALAGLALWRLAGRQFAGGLLLLAAVWIYFCLIHVGIRRRRWLVPKEAAVGMLFAVGTVFFVGCSTIPLGSTLCATGVMFGALCFLNCALITKWEASPQDRRDPASLLNAFPQLTAWLARGGAALALLASISATMMRPGIAFAPVVFGAVGLWTLDHWQEGFSKETLRVLADVVLLAPWALLWIG
jgi:hypothetical protein